MRNLYDKCIVQISYREEQSELYEISKPKLYPKKIKVNKYKQQLKIF